LRSGQCRDDRWPSFAFGDAADRVRAGGLGSKGTAIVSLEYTIRRRGDSITVPPEGDISMATTPVLREV
jgi:hypothetical protein